MPRHTVVVLGAGFSRAAGGPLLVELLDPALYDDEVLGEDGRELLQDLSTRLVDRSTESVETLFTEAWRAARTAGTVTANGRRLQGDTLYRKLLLHLGSVAARVHLRRGSGIWAAYREFFRRAYARSSSLTVVTFNYDLLVEQILDDEGLYFDLRGNDDYRIDNPGRSRGLTRHGSDVRLLKMHGSVGWGICEGCRSSESLSDVVTMFDAPYVPLRRRSCGYCTTGLLGIGIVPPIEGKAGEMSHMLSLWTSARRAVRRSTEMLVVGYSLPSADSEAQGLLLDAARSGSLKKVVVVSGPNGPSSTLLRIFPHLTAYRTTFQEYLGV